ncbi:MAG: hypothetical protein R3B09_33820 [Nannocystaceae bacterium]
MSGYGPRCPNCAAPLPDAYGGVIVCGVCRSELALAPEPEPEPTPTPTPTPELRPIQGIAEAQARRAKIEPMVQALMQRYVDRMTAGARPEALAWMEAVTYLTVWTVYDVDDLDALAPFADPAVARAAEQLGVPYVSPAERGEAVTWARVRRLLA